VLLQPDYLAIQVTIQPAQLKIRCGLSRMSAIEAVSLLVPGLSKMIYHFENF
jgi:hypothetical protein